MWAKGTCRLWKKLLQEQKLTQCEDRSQQAVDTSVRVCLPRWQTAQRNHFFKNCGKLVVDLWKSCLIGSGEAATESSERQRECVTFDFGLDGFFWEQH